MENIPTLKGVLYAKECRRVPNKKKPTEPDWEFYSIKVETKINIGGRTLTQIPELSLDKGLSYDGFEIGENIEVDYYLTGKAINEKFYKTDVKCCFIKGDPNKVKPKTDGFTAPLTPNEKRQTDESTDDGLGDLPFIVTILIGIGSLMSFMPF